MTMTPEELREMMRPLSNFCGDKRCKICNPRLDSQFTLLREAIKRIENPYKNELISSAFHFGFNSAIQAVLELLGEPEK